MFIYWTEHKIFWDYLQDFGENRKKSATIFYGQRKHDYDETLLALCVAIWVDLIGFFVLGCGIIWQRNLTRTTG